MQENITMFFAIPASASDEALFETLFTSVCLEDRKDHIKVLKS